jgi:hypothetical protein
MTRRTSGRHKVIFQTDLKSADIVSFLKNRHKVRKNDTMYADLLSEKITDNVTAGTKSGSRKTLSKSVQSAFYYRVTQSISIFFKFFL